MTEALTRLREALSTVVLLAVWLAVITPVALLARLVRGDVLGTRDPDATTYWSTPDPSRADSILVFFGSRGKLWLLPVIGLLFALGALLVASEASVVLAFLYPLF
ncbi:MAG: hypothetical protein KC656_35000 [Myxococcales bacterium]|nr:hypothetical protein [Myxococcales bacterium]